MLKETIENITPTSTLGEDHLNSLAMPPGALGQIHDIAVKLCSIQGTLNPAVDKKILFLCAADHGIAAKNVSAYPQITDSIVKAAAHGGAAINAFCQQADCQLKIINMGVNADLSSVANILHHPIANGSEDITAGPAMNREQCLKAIETGIKLAQQSECDVIALGEMGIANTSIATAVFCALHDQDPSAVTGPGTGVTGDALINKIKMIEQALVKNKPNSQDPLDVLTKVGGFEIAAISGIILGAAATRKVIILDGYITGAAALIAVALAPNCRDYLFAGHQSAEPAHKQVLDQLGLTAIIQLEMRLGEGIGAALAINVLEAACQVVSDTFTLNKALEL